MTDDMLTEEATIEPSTESAAGNDVASVEESVAGDKGNAPVKAPSKETSITLHDFKSTPYADMRWEGIERIEKYPRFRSIDVQLVPSNPLATPDPMFHRFDPIDLKDSSTAGQEGEIDAPPEPEIDEAMLEAIREEAYELGKAEGLALAEEQHAAERLRITEGQKNELQVVSQALRDAYEKRYADIEAEALQVAVQIARKVIETAVEARPEYILEVIRKALKRITHERRVTIRVSPNDFEFIEVEGLPEDLTSDSVQINFIVDDGIRGGCILETSHGELNLDVDSMWKEIAQKLFAVGT